MNKIARIVLVGACLVAAQLASAQASRFVGSWQLDAGPNRQRTIVVAPDGDNLRVRFGVTEAEPRLGLAEATLGSDGSLSIKSNGGATVVLTVADEHTLVGRFIPASGRESAARATRMSPEAAEALAAARPAPRAAAPAAPQPAEAFLSRAEMEAIATGRKWKIRRLADGHEIVWDLREGGGLFARNRTWSLDEKGELCVKWRGNSNNVCVVVARDGNAYKAYNAARPGTAFLAVSVE